MRSVDRGPTAARAAAVVGVTLALATLGGCDTFGNLMPGGSKAAPATSAAASAPAPAPNNAASQAAAVPAAAGPGRSASASASASEPTPASAPATPPPPPPPAMSVTAPAPSASLAPVSPGAQRAFDDALALLRAGRTADAEHAFRALAQSDPELAGPHANLGLIARNAGRLPEAVTELERATQLDPRLTVAWNQLGIAYRQQGQFAKSRTAYETALAIDPAYAAAALNLGILNDMYLDEPARALELYNRYLELTPAGDPVVVKWVAELKNRKPAAGGRTATAASAPASAPKEKP
jgi:tetratricopeptide (TPR) repeat protein